MTTKDVAQAPHFDETAKALKHLDAIEAQFGKNGPMVQIRAAIEAMNLAWNLDYAKTQREALAQPEPEPEPESEPVTIAYVQGFYKGIDHNCINPYFQNSDEYKAWAIGWEEGAKKQPEPAKAAEHYLRGRYGAARGHFAWRELEDAFNSGVLLGAASGIPDASEAQPETKKCSLCKEELHSEIAPSAQKRSEQKPIAYAVFTDEGNVRLWSTKLPHVEKLAKEEGLEFVSLYAAPPARNPLTPEQIDLLSETSTYSGMHPDYLFECVRAIEAAHGITGGAA